MLEVILPIYLFWNFGYLIHNSNVGKDSLHLQIRGRIEKRDLCSIEVGEANDKANTVKRAVKCSNCGTIGHTVTKCTIARNV